MKEKVLAVAFQLDRITKGLHVVAAVCMIGMGLLTLSEITARSLFDRSLPFVWEAGSYLLGASWFLAAPYTLRTDGHVRVSLVNQQLGEKGSYILDILASMAGVVITIVLFASLLQLTVDSIKFERISFTPMQTPLFIPQAVLTLGMLFMALQMIMRLILLLTGNKPDIPHEVTTDQV